MDAINKIYSYDYNGETIEVDFKNRLLEDDGGIDIKVTYKDVTSEYPAKTVSNKTFPWGSDNLGRDMLTRVMFGARISLTVAFVATIVNLIIGVTYGAISGLEGGTADDIMMRIVDVINSIPLVLYVILLMVLIDNRGLWTIIITLGSVYWVGMARLVRGQVLGLKEQEYVLAARTIGVSKAKIISKHLIPNAMGPIIVSMTMMIPSAVFTEAFLSFIGLGVSAPMASWGTLANDALSGLSTYPYQLFTPSLAIAFTMLSFNFLGDGLRSALDPRLRKG
jgi:oligopeptide transport system permease protein